MPIILKILILTMYKISIDYKIKNPVIIDLLYTA